MFVNLEMKSLLKSTSITLALRIWPSSALTPEKSETLDEQFEKMDSGDFNQHIAILYS